MKYAIVNTSLNDIQLNLFGKTDPFRNKFNRPGPKLALNIKRGTAIDLMNYVKSIEEAHELIKHSYDAKKMFKHGLLVTRITTDSGEEIDREILDELI